MRFNQKVEQFLAVAGEIKSLEDQLTRKRQFLQGLLGVTTNGNGKRRRGVQVVNYKKKYEGKGAPELLLQTISSFTRPVDFRQLSKAAFSSYGMRKGTVSSTLFNLRKARKINVKNVKVTKASGKGLKTVALYSVKKVKK